ncbi:hypothetical protein AKJ09_07204 [Labilithrix luteola]|uniref:DUF11 domain-containing protein n=1 Tax=Labilithrix luteola TaxID=1391654 RepID=A0A0K1Q3Y0_9BACT|nr:hypothetical protein AKJ09_07204 [Labilithrix luteola]
MNLATGGTALTKTLIAPGNAGPESQTDTTLGSAASLRWPKFGNAVAIVNQQGKNANVNSLKQTMTVGPADIDGVDGLAHVRFVLAPVLEDPKHDDDKQPYFFVQLTNVTQGNILYQDYNFASQPGVPWKQIVTGTAPNTNTYKYTDWALVDIAPGSAKLAPGDQVELEIIASGCQPGGHWGQVYVDGMSDGGGSSIPGLFVAATGPAAANENTDITYTLNYKNAGASTTNGTIVEFNTPPNTTFTSLNAPGLTCVTPAAGATGSVKCTVGALAVGGTGSFQITAHIDSGTSGKTITAGDYSIYATGVSPLLGPKVYTDVTKDIAYANVGVTMTSSTATTAPGQKVTYTITVTNAGPNDVSGVGFKDVLPAQFTAASATWTCVGAGGATCTATGTGGINDASISIPKNGTVTYTLTATVDPAAATPGQIANIAGVTMPANASDPDPSNNSVGAYVQILLPNGETCTTNDKCWSNICDGDHKCGLPDTKGPCTKANETVVCRSGECSNDGTCVTAGGCNIDTDCTGGTWCSISTHTCKAKLPNDTAMPTDPPHTAPALNGTCTAPAATLTCVSGVCDVNDSKCGYGTGTGPCTAANAATVCRSGACSTNGTCMPSAGCNADDDCSVNKWCNITSHACTAKVPNGNDVPSDGAHSNPTLNGKCTQDAATLTCESAVCDTDNKCGYADGTSGCTPANAGTVCRSGSCGDDGKCMPNGGCNVDSDCPSGKWCNMSSHACVAKAPNGSGVGNDKDHSSPTLDGKCSPGAGTLTCASGVCDKSDNKCGYIDGTGPCTAANGNVVCRSGACSSTGVCKPTTGCNTDSDCDRASQFCDTGAHKCTAKLDNGAPMPTVSGHTPGLDGKCTTEAAAAVCKSSVCDPTDNKCGFGNGNGPCSVTNAATVCRSGSCDPKDNKCGLQDDSGPCSDGKTCRSGNCNESKNVCGSGCKTDGDCAANQFCRTSDGVCSGKLPDGDPCSSENMCQSNTCNAQICDSIVAEGNGIGCSVQPGSDSNSGASSAAVFGIALGVASLARKRRRSGSSAR